VLRVERGRAQVLLADLRMQLRASRPRDGRRPDRAVGVDHQPPHRRRELRPAGIRVRDGDAL
jgi:hypothetical protein